MATGKIRGNHVSAVLDETNQTYGLATKVIANHSVVTVFSFGTPTTTASGWTTVATIPQGYRPIVDIQLAVPNASGQRRIFSVGTDGTVKWYDINGQVFGCISYPVNA